MNGSDWLELEEKGLIPPTMTPREALDLIKKQLMMTPQNKELFEIIEDALPFDINDKTYTLEEAKKVLEVDENGTV